MMDVNYIIVLMIAFVSIKSNFIITWKYEFRCELTNPFNRWGLVCPISFVTLIVTKSLCDCPLLELFSERELSSLGSGSSSGFGFSLGFPV